MFSSDEENTAPALLQKVESEFIFYVFLLAVFRPDRYCSPVTVIGTGLFLPIQAIDDTDLSRVLPFSRSFFDRSGSASVRFMAKVCT